MIKLGFCQSELIYLSFSSSIATIGLDLFGVSAICFSSSIATIGFSPLGVLGPCSSVSNAMILFDSFEVYLTVVACPPGPLNLGGKYSRNRSSRRCSIGFLLSSGFDTSSFSARPIADSKWLCFGNFPRSKSK